MSNEWTYEKKVSPPELITVDYVVKVGDVYEKRKAYLWQTPFTETWTYYANIAYNDKEGKVQNTDVVSERISYTYGTVAAVCGNYVKYCLSNQLGLPEGDADRYQETFYTYEVTEDGPKQVEELRKDWISEFELAGSLPIKDWTGWQPRPGVIWKAGETLSETQETKLRFSSGALRPYNKNKTTRWQALGLTQEGQQSAAEQLKAETGDGTVTISVMDAMGVLMTDGTEVSTSIGKADLQARPNAEEQAEEDLNNLEDEALDQGSSNFRDSALGGWVGDNRSGRKGGTDLSNWTGGSGRYTPGGGRSQINTGSTWTSGSWGGGGTGGGGSWGGGGSSGGSQSEIDSQYIVRLGSGPAPYGYILVNSSDPVHVTRISIGAGANVGPESAMPAAGEEIHIAWRSGCRADYRIKHVPDGRTGIKVSFIKNINEPLPEYLCQFSSGDIVRSEVTTVDVAVERVFDMPYAPDDHFRCYGGRIRHYPANAEHHAANYGAIQSTLLHGESHGVNLISACDHVPSEPFAGVYLNAAGASVYGRISGTSWAFSSEGMVVSTDFIYCGFAGVYGDLRRIRNGGKLWIDPPVPANELPSVNATPDPNWAPANSMEVPPGWDHRGLSAEWWNSELPKAQGEVPQLVQTTEHLLLDEPTTVLSAVTRTRLQLMDRDYAALLEPDAIALITITTAGTEAYNHVDPIPYAVTRTVVNTVANTVESGPEPPPEKDCTLRIGNGFGADLLLGNDADSNWDNELGIEDEPNWFMFSGGYLSEGNSLWSVNNLFPNPNYDLPAIELPEPIVINGFAWPSFRINSNGTLWFEHPDFPNPSTNRLEEVALDGTQNPSLSINIGLYGLAHCVYTRGSNYLTVRVETRSYYTDYENGGISMIYELTFYRRDPAKDNSQLIEMKLAKYDTAGDTYLPEMMGTLRIASETEVLTENSNLVAGGSWVFAANLSGTTWNLQEGRHIVNECGFYSQRITAEITHGVVVSSFTQLQVTHLNSFVQLPTAFYAGFKHTYGNYSAYQINPAKIRGIFPALYIGARAGIAQNPLWGAAASSTPSKYPSGNASTEAAGFVPSSTNTYTQNVPWWINNNGANTVDLETLWWRRDTGAAWIMVMGGFGPYEWDYSTKPAHRVARGPYMTQSALLQGHDLDFVEHYQVGSNWYVRWPEKAGESEGYSPYWGIPTGGNTLATWGFIVRDRDIVNSYTSNCEGYCFHTLEGVQVGDGTQWPDRVSQSYFTLNASYYDAPSYHYGNNTKISGIDEKFLYLGNSYSSSTTPWLTNGNYRAVFFYDRPGLCSTRILTDPGQNVEREVNLGFRPDVIWIWQHDQGANTNYWHKWVYFRAKDTDGSNKVIGIDITRYTTPLEAVDNGATWIGSEPSVLFTSTGYKIKRTVAFTGSSTDPTRYFVSAMKSVVVPWAKAGGFRMRGQQIGFTYSGSPSYSTAGEFHLSGLEIPDAIVLPNPPFLLEAGSFTLTGQEAGGIEIEWLHLEAEGGTVQLDDGAPTHTTLVFCCYPDLDGTGAAEFSLYGFQAGYELARHLDLAVGGFVLSGSDIVLDYDRWLHLFGQRAEFELTFHVGYQLKRRLACGTGSFETTGQRTLNSLMRAEGGQFELSGSEALAGRPGLSASVGQFLLSGGELQMRPGALWVAEAGSFVLSGAEAGSTKDYHLHAAAIPINTFGQAAELRYSRALVLSSSVAQYLLNGAEAALGLAFKAEAGGFELSGGEAGRSAAIGAAVGAYELSGLDARMGPLAGQLAGEAGSFVATGQDATLTVIGVGTFPRDIVSVWHTSYTGTGQQQDVGGSPFVPAMAYSVPTVFEYPVLDANNEVQDEGAFGDVKHLVELLWSRVAPKYRNINPSGFQEAFSWSYLLQWTDDGITIGQAYPGGTGQNDNRPPYYGGGMQNASQNRYSVNYKSGEFDTPAEFSFVYQLFTFNIQNEQLTGGTIADDHSEENVGLVGEEFWDLLIDHSLTSHLEQEWTEDEWSDPLPFTEWVDTYNTNPLSDVFIPAARVLVDQNHGHISIGNVSSPNKNLIANNVTGSTHERLYVPHGLAEAPDMVILHNYSSTNNPDQISEFSNQRNNTIWWMPQRWGANNGLRMGQRVGLGSLQYGFNPTATNRGNQIRTYFADDTHFVLGENYEWDGHIGYNSAYPPFSTGNVPEGGTFFMALKRTPGVLEIGTYSGDGTGSLWVPCGFRPGLIWAKASNADSDWYVHWRPNNPYADGFGNCRQFFNPKDPTPTHTSGVEQLTFAKGGFWVKPGGLGNDATAAGVEVTFVAFSIEHWRIWNADLLGGGFEVGGGEVGFTYLRKYTLTAEVGAMHFCDACSAQLKVTRPNEQPLTLTARSGQFALSGHWLCVEGNCRIELAAAGGGFELDGSDAALVWPERSWSVAAGSFELNGQDAELIDLRLRCETGEFHANLQWAGGSTGRCEEGGGSGAISGSVPLIWGPDPTTASTYDGSGWTVARSSHADDSYLLVDFPAGYELTIWTRTFTSFYVGTNAYFTFGGASSTYSVSLSSPSYDKLLLMGGDRAQRLCAYADLGDRFVVRSEMSSSYSSSATTNMVVEVSFFPGQQLIEVNWGQQAGGGTLFCVATTNAALSSTGAATPNTTYLFSGNETGQEWLRVDNAHMGAGAATYCLYSDCGSFALSGGDAQKLDYRFMVEAGYFRTRGRNSTYQILIIVAMLLGWAGEFELSGSAANGGRNYRMSAGGGAFLLGGRAAGGPYNQVLRTENGSFALAGSAAGGEYQRQISASVAQYQLTGGAAEFTYLRNLKLNAEALDLRVIGQFAQFWKVRSLNARGAASFSYSGRAAGGLLDQALRTDFGQYLLSSVATELRYTRKLVFEAKDGGFQLNGEAGLNRHYALSAAAGSFSLEGYAAGGIELEFLVLQAGVGHIDLEGQQALLALHQVAVFLAGTCVLTGMEAELRFFASRTLVGEQGSFALTGRAAGFLQDQTIGANNGVFVTAGMEAGYTYLQNRRLNAETGTVTLDGPEIRMSRFSDGYWESWVAQTYGWEAPFLTDWWAD